ncbi:RidA family protein [Thalassotalea euphylliae]|uniref:RidA family protein n=1 Tax=Thalassotalea euphylliae TaxID=1655234 RepID=A0A3E0TM31_9GAMM|nr:Rid family detoxifying hydrolase [Thalassotalea euphylliae]REL25614.1 RidA family protein [Thalassotalea euphylliae]
MKQVCACSTLKSKLLAAVLTLLFVPLSLATTEHSTEHSTGHSTEHNTEHSIEFLNTKPSNKALPFSEAVKVGNTLYLSGQIGWHGATGKLAQGGFEGEAHQVMKNIKGTLTQYGYQMSDVVKCLVMLTDIKQFKAFNQVYSQYFSAPYPARSAFAVSELAAGALVEVECIAAVN